MSVGHVLLGLLEPQPAHGYTLKAAYDESFGRDRPLKYGQVYATLTRLQRDGLAVHVGVEAGDGPERRLYAVTPEGVSELDSWLSAAEPATERTRSTLFAKTVLALSTGRPAGEILDRQRTAHLARMREVRAGVVKDDAVGRLAADYELAHLQADLRWIELAVKRLEQGQLGGLR